MPRICARSWLPLDPTLPQPMPPDLATLERTVARLSAAGQWDQAEALLRPLLASGSGPLPHWRLLAGVLRGLGRLDEVRQIQEMLVASVPGDLAARFDLAETLLLLGDFERGWREYQYRYSLPHTTRIGRHIQRPRWDGRRLDGKTLLVHDEQGYGDSLQFLRMVPWAKARSGAQLILEITPELAPLADRAGGVDQVIRRGTLPPPFDAHCEMMSLPLAMGLKQSDLPGTIPYLSADPARLRAWHQRLAEVPGPLVALVWAGRPTHHNDVNRSMALADFAPLATPGVTFLAIQKGPRAAEAQAPPPGMTVLSLDAEIIDFEDTAAILSIADLLISVDSSPVHLAGALGRPAWVLLPFLPDWRWLLQRDDTPWYPTVRLFRQPAPGDWPAVIAKVKEALPAALLSKSRKRTDGC